MEEKIDLSKLNFQDVESSNLSAVALNDNTLYVKFHSGSVYAYPGVSKDLYEEMLGAESKGKFFNSKIKNVFEFKKVI